jgi:Flp pilus assembly protein TadB
MGLIRKSLMIGTLGGVSGSSKKQRVAKASLQELKQQTALLAQIADPEASARQRAEAQATLERQQARTAERRAARQQRSDERRAARTQLAEDRKKAAANTPWLSAAFALRLCGWTVAIFFALGAIGGAAAGSTVGVIGCSSIVALVSYFLRRPRKVLTQSSTEVAPASQEPTR